MQKLRLLDKEKEMKRKIRKYKGGGMDAAKADFKSPAQAFTPSPGDTGGEGGNVTNNNKTTNTTGSNNVTTKKKGLNIPIVGPVTLGINVLQKLIKPKTAEHPFSANTVKQTKTKPSMGRGGGERPQLCPDGTMPPCKTKPIIKPNQANKSNFLEGFKAYNKGGGVPYGPPPLRGPNPQVPPIKFSRGGGSAIRGTKFKGVF